VTWSDSALIQLERQILEATPALDLQHHGVPAPPRIAASDWRGACNAVPQDMRMLRSLAVKSSTFAGALGALALAGAWPAQAAERVDCRYYRTDELSPSAPGEGPGPLESMLLPDKDVFRPILADQREPRFYADYRRLHFRGANQLSEGHGDDINVAWSPSADSSASGD